MACSYVMSVDTSNKNIQFTSLSAIIADNVQRTLVEDIGTGDITALLLPKSACAEAHIVTKEPMILCGKAWADEVFKQIDSDVKVSWQYNDGDFIEANNIVCYVSGFARSILTGERSALNFLQLLSGTATECRQYVNCIKHTQVTLLDSRKTIPGLRQAQKYAVTQGGCSNHRMGLYDAFLIKENHIIACGGISESIRKARLMSKGQIIEIEVESILEFSEALKECPDIIMLDNFSLKEIKDAVKLVKGQCKLEVSGGITLNNIKPIAETGVDYISIGALTKNCNAIDLSLRINMSK